MSRTLKTTIIFLVSFYSIIIFTTDSGAQQSRKIKRPRTKQALNKRPDKAERELNRILEEWSSASKRIKRLEGKHTRYVYESTFKTVKYCTGLFLYEGPDKGRIDLTPYKTSKKEMTKEGVTYEIKTQKAERWICDGKQILGIDDEEKFISVTPIPTEAQGENIMDGPLPFLFGMPPEKAKKRYKMKLMGTTENHYRLYVLPRMKKDAVSWKEAFVYLDRRTYLPSGVKLTDQTGTTETVYTFNEIKVNKKRGLLGRWFKGDPFNPRMPGYKRENVKRNPEKQRKYVDDSHDDKRSDRRGRNLKKAARDQVKLTKVPTLIGLKYKEAEAQIKKQGFKPKFKRGSVATSKKLVYRVEEQSPKPGSMINKGDSVILILYDSPAKKHEASKLNK
jgi:TIGR03009 family protein